MAMTRFLPLFQGCDGSILVDGPTAEKRSGPHAGVRGYELIEGVKSQLEQMCPGVVSCSDIVAMAARDAVALVKTTIFHVGISITRIKLLAMLFCLKS